MKTLKSLIILTLVLGVATLNSCKKDKKTPTNGGTMSATIDGTDATFNNNTSVVTGSTGGNNFTAIQGNASDGSSMSITIYGTLTAGTTYTSNDPDESEEPVLLYVSGSDSYLNDVTNPSVTIKITTVNSSSIQGTFSGTIIDIGSGANQGKSKVVTNGTFNVPR